MRTAPASAGIAYVIAWASGLAAWPTNLDVSASRAKVLTTYAGHQGAAITQYLLVEGLAAIALGVVVIAIGRAASERTVGSLRIVAVLAGLSAVCISLIQTVLGLVLAGAAVPHADSGAAEFLFHTVNRLDGVKMLALAVMALATVGAVSRAVRLPRWLDLNAWFLTAALLVSGLGYLLLNQTLAQAATVSLPLLLLWVAGAGINLGRVGR